MNRDRGLRSFASLVACALVACASPSGEEVARIGLAAETPLPARRGAVLVDGCVLDTWSRTALAQPATRKVVSEVVMLCLVPRESGEVGPRDASARASVAALVADLRRDGYSVTLGVAFTDESGQRYDGAQTRDWLSRPAFRQRLRDTLVEAAALADGVELDLQKLPNDARADVTALVSELSVALRPSKRLAVFVPPSVATPSDLPGGEAFDRVALAPLVDRLRVMTLDYSETSAGPTIDPGWAVDAGRLARRSSSNVDVSVPLYGTDFGPRGRRSVTWFEAVAIAGTGGTTARGPTGAPFVRYARDGEAHELWFDDAESTGLVLGAMTPDALPLDVGVLFYGLGAEDPSLFARLAARMP